MCAICHEKTDEFGEGVVCAYKIEGVLAKQSIFHTYFASHPFAFSWGRGICFAHQMPNRSSAQITTLECCSPLLLTFMMVAFTTLAAGRSSPAFPREVKHPDFFSALWRSCSWFCSGEEEEVGCFASAAARGCRHVCPACLFFAEGFLPLPGLGEAFLLQAEGCWSRGMPVDSFSPSLRAHHVPAATSELGLFIETLSSKKVFPPRGTFSATQSPSNCEDMTHHLHKINLFS